tara:strand:- start:59 stop:538 length:480 start_codon:yes stop_codon:yes gene_type:complete
MVGGPDIEGLRQRDREYRVKHRARVRAEVERRGLGSVMNQTRWTELRAAIRDLPFAPPYQRQDVLERPEPLWPSDQQVDPGCWCDECLEPLYAIEWLRIIPRLWRQEGALLPLKPAGDCTEALRAALSRLNIPFREDDRGIWIHGYASGDPTLDPAADT